MAQLAHHMTGSAAAGGGVGYNVSDDDRGTGRRRRQSKRQKEGSQKRKLEKAQEHLRSKMRQRLNGPAMVSSRVQHRVGASSVAEESREVHRDDNRGSVSLKEERTNAGHVGGSKKGGNKKKQLTGNYWRSQQQRYTNLTHPMGGTTGNRTTTTTSRSQEEVPLHDLVDRVLQRQNKSKNISPLIIRAYNKPPNPQFKLQQHPLARTLPTGQPVASAALRKHPKDKGPYVLFLQHRDQPPHHHQEESEDGYNPEINTWRPELEGVATRDSLRGGGEDRSVTNYKLQLQHAAKLAEARFDYSNRPKKFDALPPIPKVSQQQQSDGSRSRPGRQRRNGAGSSSSPAASSPSDSEESDEDNMQTNGSNDRAVSKQDILTQMKAYKRSRRRVSENDFKTILRTRNRFTAKTKQFKEDLTKASALSIIDEDQSSVSSGRASCLSARRPSQTSLRNVSAKSLNRIEETKTPEPEHAVQEAKQHHQSAVVDRRTSVIEEDDEEADMVIDDDDDDDDEEEDRTSVAGGMSYEFSSSSNPLPPIMHRLSDSNIDSEECDIIATRTTQNNNRKEQTIVMLPSKSVIPEIGK